MLHAMTVPEPGILNEIIEGLDDAVVVTDADFIIQYANPAYQQLTGRSAEQSIGQRGCLNRCDLHDDTFYEAIQQRLASHGRWEGEIWDRHANGKAYLRRLLLRRLVDDRGRTTHHIARFEDLSEKKQTEAKLEQLTHYDPLTELPNRLLFRNRLSHEFHIATRHKTSTGIILLNLDRFREINDTFGFNHGDNLLKAVAERFGRCIRRTDLMAREENRIERDPDLVSRMSGDAFAFILSDMRRPDDAGVVADRLLEALHEPFRVLDEEVYISASMGIATFPQNATGEDELLHRAEEALAQAKSAHRGHYRFYSEAMNVSSANRVRLEAQLRRSLAAEGFELYYQPKFELASGRITGLEALIRWPTETGLVSPADFIPLAEDTGLINPLGEWILQRALNDVVALPPHAGQPLAIAVNLSARQFQNRDLTTSVDQALTRSGIDPQRVELEITEGMLMHNADEACETMQRLRALGVRLAIDDFGTGYSSLAYLHRFPVNTLKIDRTFVQTLGEARSDSCIIDAVIGLGHGLGLEVVAEGIEQPAQLQRLRDAGCQLGQGFLIARPMSLPALQRWLSQQPAITGT